MHTGWRSICIDSSAHASAPLLSLTGCALEYFTRSRMDKRCLKYSRWPWDLQTISFSYGSRYVIHASTSPVTALYSAANRRHGLASDTVGYGSRSRGFLMNMCSGTANVCGCRCTTIVAARHNSISDNAVRRAVFCRFACHGIYLGCERAHSAKNR